MIDQLKIIPRELFEAIFTKDELEALISLVEMTMERADVEFSAWLEANPKEEATLTSVDEKLRFIERVVSEVRSRPQGKTLVTYQLYGKSPDGWDTGGGDPIADIRAYVQKIMPDKA